MDSVFLPLFVVRRERRGFLGFSEVVAVLQQWALSVEGMCSAMSFFCFVGMECGVHTECVPFELN